ncbi:hypothetical protein [Azotobacter salinestris]|uniref:hypothetical protein n=1 Tax=Azotobacter salinestris TaxID=69964 RepID=UPI0032DEFCC7
MLRYFKHNLVASYLLFSLALFTGLNLVQYESNALPFLYKDYPTYAVNGERQFDRNSENLVLNRIEFAVRDIPYPYSFHLWRSAPAEAEPADRQSASGPLAHGAPYRSQIGVQAWFWAGLTELLDIHDAPYRLQKTLSVLLAALVTAVPLVWMRKHFGTLPSLAGLAFLSLSTGMNLFAGSLYWSLWLFMLPLAVTCLLDLLGIRNRYALFLATLPAFLVKFLAGYEFITVIVLASMTPHAWAFFIRRDTGAAFRALVVGISSICAFLISLLHYDLLFSANFGLSGLDHLLGRSQAWSIRSLDEHGLTLWSQVAKLLAMNFIDFNGYGVPLGLCLALMALALLHARRQLHAAELGFVLFLLLGSASWLLIQPGHLLFHPRYATLVFSLPCGLFTVGFIARLSGARHRKDAGALAPSRPRRTAGFASPCPEE